MTPAAKHDKQARLLRIVNALRAGRVKIASNCKQLLKEMASYEWDQDGNDHLIDAFNYGYNNATIPDIPKEDRFEDPRLVPKAIKRQDSDYQDFGD